MLSNDSYIRITLFKKFFIHNIYRCCAVLRCSCMAAQFLILLLELPIFCKDWGFAVDLPFFVRIGLLLLFSSVLFCSVLFCSVLFCSVLFKENWSRNERTSFLWHTWSAAAHHIQFQIRFQSWWTAVAEILLRRTQILRVVVFHACQHTWQPVVTFNQGSGSKWDETKAKYCQTTSVSTFVAQFVFTWLEIGWKTRLENMVGTQLEYGWKTRLEHDWPPTKTFDFTCIQFHCAT